MLMYVLIKDKLCDEKFLMEKRLSNGKGKSFAWLLMPGGTVYTESSQKYGDEPSGTA